MRNGRSVRAMRSIAVLATVGFALGGCVGWDRVFSHRSGNPTHPAGTAPSCWSSDQQSLERALSRTR